MMYADDNQLYIIMRNGNQSQFVSAVEPPVSEHPKCKDWVVAYGRWSFTRIENHREVSSEKRSRHIYIVEDNLWLEMSKLGYV